MIVKSMKISDLTIPNTIDGGYLIQALDGLQNADAKLPFVDFPTRHGALLLNNLYVTRKIAVGIEVVGTSAEDFIAKRLELMEALSIARTTEIPLEFTLRNDAVIITSGMVKTVRDGTGLGQITNGRITAEFECYDPALYESTLNQETIHLRDIAGGAEIPAEIPMALGAADDEGMAVCTNAGNFLSYPSIQITGVCLNPIIQNGTTGKELQFNVELTGANDYISIDMKNQAATMTVGGNVTNIMPYLDSTKNDFWWLDPGDNEVIFTHEGVYNENVVAYITWRSAYIGV